MRRLVVVVALLGNGCLLSAPVGQLAPVGAGSSGSTGGGAGSGTTSGSSGSTSGSTGTDSPFRAVAASTIAAPLLAADFDGDGRLDLLASNGGYLLLRGTGDGSFAAPVSVDLGGTPTGRVLAGDFDGDGHLDLAAGLPQGAVGVALNPASGTSGPPVLSNVGADPAQAGTIQACADFDGDGRLDLAGITDSLDYAQVTFFRGQGDGSFRAPVTTPAPQATRLMAADFNGDGAPDLALDLGGNGLGVMLGRGDGTFQPMTSLPFWVRDFWAVADLDRDGKLDLLLDSQVLLGNGDGTFRALPDPGLSFNRNSSSPPVLGDIDGDGRLDVVALAAADPGAGPALYENLGNGDGTFQLLAEPVGAWAERATHQIPLNLDAWQDLERSLPVLGDFNGDGRLDLALGTAGGFWGGPPLTVLLAR